MAQLASWEKRLQPRFTSRLRIIGEIPLSETDLDELAEVIKHYIRQSNLRKATDFITQNCPLTFLTLLAHFSAYNDQQGYWHNLAEKVGSPHISLFNASWHKEFVKLAQKYGLKTFSINDSPNFYVMSIRYHGGIPTHSLPDFFERMVKPAVSREGLREQAAKDALKYLLENVYFVDSPVLDFLSNSGELGEVFFEQCCTLYRHAIENHGEILPRSQVPDLPEYIFSNFERWYEGKEDSHFHWQKPWMKIAPFAEENAISLVLPGQVIPMELTRQHLEWQTWWSGLDEPQKLDCRLAKRRQDRIIIEDFLSLPEPVASLTVSLAATDTQSGEETILRRWSIPFIPGEERTPLLAFHENGRKVASEESIPADLVYLLKPRNSELIVEGRGQKEETFGALIGAWTDYHIEAWDLSEAISILLSCEGNPVGTVIPVQREMAQPVIEGGHRFQFQDDENEVLFTSALPKLKIPIRPGLAPEVALAGWKVHIQSRWEAAPFIDVHLNLEKQTGDLVIENERAYLPLENVLTRQAAGIYDIHVDGPRGIKEDLRLRAWPKLLVVDHSLDLPDFEDMRKPMHFYLKMQDGAECEAQAVSDGLLIAPDPRGWKITVPMGVKQAALNLLAPAEGGGKVRVPVTIPMPRLYWDLSEERNGYKVDFAQQLIHRSLDQFMQAGSCSLHVEMAGLREMREKLTCRLVAYGEEKTVLQEARFTRSDFRPDWLLVGLGQFIGTLGRITDTSRFELVYQKDHQSEEIRYPLLEINRELAISEVALEQVGEVSWLLKWHEQPILRNRRVMICPAWKPWEKAMEFKIPNNRKSEFKLNDLALPPSRYALYFYILPDWEEEQTRPPNGGKSHIIDMIEPQARIDSLQVVDGTANQLFQAAIEKACIQDSLGNMESRDICISEAAPHLLHLTDVNILVGCLQWIKAREIKAHIKSYFLKSMFRPELVKPILEKYEQSDPGLQEFLQMTIDADSIYAESAKMILARVDDPQAISSCLKQLVKRKDHELPQIITKMVEQARLSKGDAVYLLSETPEAIRWMVEKLCELPVTPATNNLIADLLPMIYEDEKENPSNCLLNAIARVMFLVKDKEMLVAYLTTLIKAEHPNSFAFILQARENNLISEEVFSELLTMQPAEALAFLREQAEREDLLHWITWLEDRFPAVAGIYLASMEIMTPFGSATVEKIENLDGTMLFKAHQDDENFILYVTSGEGRDQFKVKIDFHSNVLTFAGNPVIWGCGHCEFIHPIQEAVNAHCRNEHREERTILRKITSTLRFSADQIKPE